MRRIRHFSSFTTQAQALLSVLAVFTLFSVTAIHAQEYQSGVLLVKFRAKSPLLRLWEKQGRKGEIPDWKPLLGAHRSEALFDDGLINSVIERFGRLTEDDPTRRASTLTRWCQIRFASKADAAFLAGKVKMLPDVEYAEPRYYRSLTDAPNDPFLGTQQHLSIIRALEAWDVVQSRGDTSQSVILAVVDSGVDYDHEDLAANIYVNPGESGMDAQGRDKRTNGVDDDRNGRVDDWRGWDFASGSAGESEDNAPKAVLSPHGTHVAGIAGAVVNNGIGIAGAARNIRLMPIKCLPDGSRDGLVHGYRGIVYAATMGASVINCSWGDYNRSQAEQEAIEIATELGSLVIATAGNDRRYAAFYPGSYDKVCSVVWLENDDVLLQGNYHETADIGAPGTSIYSTFPDNRYNTLSGSSMSAPMVAAAAALVKMRFPRLSPMQILTRLKTTADNNDRINPEVAGRIGTGRLNMLRAVQIENPPFIEVRSFTVQDENNNGILESGERITVALNLANSAAPITVPTTVRLRTTIASNSRFLPFFDDTTKQIAPLAANEVRMGAVVFSFRLTTNLSQNFSVPLMFSMTGANGNLIGRDAITLVAERSFATLRNNNINVTINSRGNFGYNNYPDNSQGDGFFYAPSDTTNLLFEGGLVVAQSEDNVSSSVRDRFKQRDLAFLATSLLDVSASQDSALLTARAAFADLGSESQAGVSVEQTVQQYRQPSRQNMITSSYVITNTTRRTFSNLSAGLFFDWDIGNFSTNETYWDNECRCGIAQNIGGDFPVVGVKLLSPQTPTFFPITQGDTLPNAISLDNGFPRSEKYRTLTSGIVTSRKTGDIAHIVGASGMTLQPSTSVLVRFGIAAGLTLEEVRRSFRSLSEADTIASRLYPNPAAGSAFLEYQLSDEQNVVVELFNSFGQIIATPVNDVKSRGWHQSSFALDNLSAGLYFVRLRTPTMVFTKPLIVSR